MLCMDKLLSPYRAYIYALLRIVAGLLFAQHGAQKLFGALGGQPVELMSQMGLAGVIEFVGGLMIALGLFASPVAFLASGQMAVAYFQFHFPQSFFPTVNNGTSAVLYCFIFLYFVFSGAGVWSLDAVIARSRQAVRR